MKYLQTAKKVATSIKRAFSEANEVLKHYREFMINIGDFEEGGSSFSLSAELIVLLYVGNIK